MFPIFNFPRMIPSQQNRSYFSLFDRSRNAFYPNHNQVSNSDDQTINHLSQYPPGTAFKVKNDSRTLSLIGVLRDGNVLLCDNNTQTLEWYKIEDIEEV